MGWRNMGRRSTFAVGLLIGAMMMLPLWLTPMYHSMAYKTVIINNEIECAEISERYSLQLGGIPLNVSDGDMVLMAMFNSTGDYINIAMMLGGSGIIKIYGIWFCNDDGDIFYNVITPALYETYSTEDPDIKLILCVLNVVDPVLELKIWVW